MWLLRRVDIGFVPNMRVPAKFYVNELLQSLLIDELEQYVTRGNVGGFMPAVKQLANVAAMPGTQSTQDVRAHSHPPPPSKHAWAPAQALSVSP